MMMMVSDDEVDIIIIIMIDRSMEPCLGHVTRLYRCLAELVGSA